MSIIDTATKIAVLKHLHENRSFDQTAAFTRTTPEQVRQVAQAHGYPNRDNLAQAITRLEEKAADEGSDLTHKTAAAIPAARTAPQLAPSQPAQAAAAAVTQPDEIRVLINTAKGHPAKRIQAAANKLLDDVDKLKRLLAEDQEKHAARRAADAEKAAARAEVERLEGQLREAKAKLKPAGTPKSKTAASSSSDGPTAADVRSWAAENGIDCPTRGVLPQRVRDAYQAAHTGSAA